MCFKVDVICINNTKNTGTPSDVRQDFLALSKQSVVPQRKQNDLSVEQRSAAKMAEKETISGGRQKYRESGVRVGERHKGSFL